MSNESTVNARWKWLMDIIFAGILVEGFQLFGQAFDKFSSEPRESVAVASLCAAGAIGFFIYDVTVYQVLTERFPYLTGSRSALRFALDVLMALILALFLFPALTGNPWHHTARILVAVSVWHGCAVVWHLLADPKAAVRRSWTHLAMVGSYWATVTVAVWITTAVEGGSGGYFFVVDSRPCLAVLAIMLATAAAVRTCQVWKLLGAARPLSNAPLSEAASSAQRA